MLHAQQIKMGGVRLEQTAHHQEAKSCCFVVSRSRIGASLP
jgi:hypothetical protein